ncbi:MAG: cobalamin-dependent protein [Candidatus Diapherotrites archaeon]|nr:cobalamin-dependent protein [Candidatus Diapherotrites archaeon]
MSFERKVANPPLGAMMIADAVGGEVYPINASVEKIPEFVKRRRKPYHVVGFTTWPVHYLYEEAETIRNLVEVIKRIRKERPETLIVLGGHGVHNFTEQFMKNTHAHVGVLGVHGEAVGAMKELVEKLPENAVRDGELTEEAFNALKEVKGLVIKYKGKLYHTGEREVPHSLPAVSYRADRGGGQKVAKDSGRGRVGVVAVFPERALCEKSLSLPCLYCDMGVKLQKFKEDKELMRSITKPDVDKTVAEIVRGVATFRRKRVPVSLYHISFQSDALRPDFVLEVMKRLEGKGYDLKKFEFGWFMRPDQLTDENIKKIKEMRKKASISLAVGLEFGNTEELKDVRFARGKYRYPRDLRKRLKDLAESGVFVNAFHILTTPLTDLEKLKKNIEFAEWSCENLDPPIVVQPFIVPAGYMRELGLPEMETGFEIDGKEWIFPKRFPFIADVEELEKMRDYLKEKIKEYGGKTLPVLHAAGILLKTIDREIELKRAKRSS